MTPKPVRAKKGLPLKVSFPIFSQEQIGDVGLFVKLVKKISRYIPVSRGYAPRQGPTPLQHSPGDKVCQSGQHSQDYAGSHDQTV